PIVPVPTKPSCIGSLLSLNIPDKPWEAPGWPSSEQVFLDEGNAYWEYISSGNHRDCKRLIRKTFLNQLLHPKQIVDKLVNISQYLQHGTWNSHSPSNSNFDVARGSGLPPNPSYD